MLAERVGGPMNNDKRRQRQKGRHNRVSFAGIPREVMDRQNYKNLSGSAVKVLMILSYQFKGHNNGDLCAAWSLMKKHGMKSRDTLSRAILDLIDSGMIDKTRQGGLHQCSLYAVTWHPIDECNGKLDVQPTHVPSARWRLQSEGAKIKAPNTESVPIRHDIRAVRSKVA